MTPTPAVLFDVDGTLVDTNYLHAVAWFRAFRQVGAQVSMADVHRRIGVGGGRLVDALVPVRGPALDDVGRCDGRHGLEALVVERNSLEPAPPPVPDPGGHHERRRQDQ